MQTMRKILQCALHLKIFFETAFEFDVTIEDLSVKRLNHRGLLGLLKLWIISCALQVRLVIPHYFIVFYFKTFYLILPL